MLLPYLKVLNDKKVILGSQSKSRNELMSSQRIKYDVIPSTFKQDLDKTKFQHPSQYNLETCRGKVQQLLSRFQQQHISWDLLICGDTIVEHNQQIIQKPEDKQHCISMMKGLADQTHRIYTAHIIVFNTGQKELLRDQWVTKAQVTFGSIEPQVLQQFSKQPQPYRHSGGYQLTAMSGSFLKSINGSHSAVQGLDMYEICRRIVKGGKELKWF